MNPQEHNHMHCMPIHNCHFCGEVEGHHVFFFATEDIYEEVYKRTSFLSKFRAASDSVSHSLEAGSFTRDERFMFNPFLEEAASRLYEYVKPYMHEVHDALSINITDHHTHDYKWFKSLNDALTLTLNSTQIQNLDSVDLIYDVTYNYADVLSDTKVACRFGIEYNVVSPNGDLHPHRERVDFSFSWGETQITVKVPLHIGPMESFAGLDYNHTKTEILHVNSEMEGVIRKGDIIELEDGNYVAVRDVLAYDFIPGRTIVPVTAEMVNGVRYTVNVCRWQNKALFIPAYNAIKEALIDWVIYSWYMNTIPAEATAWLDKYTDNCQRITDTLQSIDGNKVKRRYRYW